MRATFHIHVDATQMSIQLLAKLQAIGFVETNFSGHPEGFRHFEPDQHLTLKLHDYKEFLSKWDEAVGTLDADLHFVGYLEGECIKISRLIPEKQYVPYEVPFMVERRSLDGSEKEQFRQSELHLTMDKDASNPSLIQKLLQAGLYGAYIPKQDHIALVLTAQGYERDVKQLTKVIWEYLEKTGGVVKGKLKEEVAIAHKLYGVEISKLPEIISKWEMITLAE